MATAITPRTRPLMPNKRKPLDPKSPAMAVRLAVRLRKFLDEQNIGPTEFRQRLEEYDLNVSLQSVQCWLNATRFPHQDHFEPIGWVVLGDDGDWREIFPSSKSPKARRKR